MVFYRIDAVQRAVVPLHVCVVVVRNGLKTYLIKYASICIHKIWLMLINEVNHAFQPGLLKIIRGILWITCLISWVRRPVQILIPWVISVIRHARKRPRTIAILIYIEPSPAPC